MHIHSLTNLGHWNTPLKMATANINWENILLFLFSILVLLINMKYISPGVDVLS